MRRMALATMMALAFSAWTGGGALAVTQDEVKSFVDDAAKYVKANGKDAGLAEFNKKDGKFVKGELYIFALDFNGTTLAHGANEKLIGKNLFEMNLKSADGKMFMKEMAEVAKSSGTGWVEYMWTNPETKKVQPKISYIVKVDETYFIGAGAYK